jgi:hypothetical protein
MSTITPPNPPGLLYRLGGFVVLVLVAVVALVVLGLGVMAASGISPSCAKGTATATCAPDLAPKSAGRMPAPGSQPRGGFPSR